jgi:hypothetical protein
VTASVAQFARPKWQVWTGRVITGLLVLFLLFDASLKLFKVRAALDGTMRIGYSESVVRPLGVVLFLCTVLYMIPRTSFIGAILLTGNLGGATATHVRVGEQFLFPILFGVLVWVALYLRREWVRSFMLFSVKIGGFEWPKQF